MITFLGGLPSYVNQTDRRSKYLDNPVHGVPRVGTKWLFLKIRNFHIYQISFVKWTFCLEGPPSCNIPKYVDTHDITYSFWYAFPSIWPDLGEGASQRSFGYVGFLRYLALKRKSSLELNDLGGLWKLEKTWDFFHKSNWSPSESISQMAISKKQPQAKTSFETRVIVELHHSFPASTNHLFDYMHLIKNHQYLRCMTVLICLQTHGNSLYDFGTCLYFAVWHLSFCCVLFCWRTVCDMCVVI